MRNHLVKYFKIMPGKKVKKVKTAEEEEIGLDKDFETDDESLEELADDEADDDGDEDEQY